MKTKHSSASRAGSTPSTQPTRRQFLASGAATGGALIIGVHIAGCADMPSDGRSTAAMAKPMTSAMPNAWVKVGSDNSVTLICARSEMGQGVYTAMPTLLAEELNVDMAKVKVAFAPAGEPYINMAIGGQLTGGSTSTRDAFDRLRVAGAQARIMLVQAAANQWGVPAAQCRAENAVVHGPTAGQQATYGQLAEAAAKIEPPKDPALKPASQFRYIGKSMARLDTPAKVDGSAVFGIDVKVPGMGIAALAQCPAMGGKVKSFDASAALAMPGVRKVVQITDGVAVVADTYWHARKGLNAVNIVWDESAQAGISTTAIMSELRGGAGKLGASFKKTGDADAAIASAAKKLEAEYVSPYAPHVTMEPMNFTADVRADSCRLIGPTQFQQLAVGMTAATLGMKPEQVSLDTTFLGGGFGRRVDVDYVIQAVEISKAAGMPVKLIWSREDDMTHDFYRPATIHKMAAGLDAAGKPVAWKFSLAGSSVTKRLFGAFVKDGIDPFMLEYAPVPYDIANQTGTTLIMDGPVRVGYLRSVSHASNTFANESFIDELAAAAGKDPVQYRRDLLAKEPKYLRVLNTVAERSGWGKAAAGIKQGVAIMEGYGSYCGLVVDCSVSGNTIKVHKATVVVDIGQMINPNLVNQQIESAFVYGMSLSMYDTISIDKGRVQQTNFHNYRVARINEVPPMDVHIIAEGGAPGGIGEPITAMVAPAVANAVFAATGKRLRSTPLSLG